MRHNIINSRFRLRGYIYLPGSAPRVEPHAGTWLASSPSLGPLPFLSSTLIRKTGRLDVDFEGRALEQ